MDRLVSNKTALVLLAFQLLCAISPGRSTITLKDNGYSGLLVAISEDITLPEDDDGVEFIDSLKVKTKNSHKILMTVTDLKFFFFL